jgi:hypothetical protein
MDSLEALGMVFPESSRRSGGWMVSIVGLLLDAVRSLVAEGRSHPPGLRIPGNSGRHGESVTQREVTSSRRPSGVETALALYIDPFIGARSPG